MTEEERDIEARYGSRTLHALLDILDTADAAERLVARSKPAYDADEMLRFAAQAIVQRIGEAVGRLPPEFVADHAATASWRAMRGMRNVVTHGYERIDYELVWAALEQRLPGEAERVRRLLGAGA